MSLQQVKAVGRSLAYYPCNPEFASAQLSPRPHPPPCGPPRVDAGGVEPLRWSLRTRPHVGTAIGKACVSVPDTKIFFNRGKLANDSAAT